MYFAGFKPFLQFLYLLATCSTNIKLGQLKKFCEHLLHCAYFENVRLLELLWLMLLTRKCVQVMWYLCRNSLTVPTASKLALLLCVYHAQNVEDAVTMGFRETKTFGEGILHAQQERVQYGRWV